MASTAAAPVEPRGDGVDGGRADRHPPHLRALAEHGDEPAVEVAVADAQPATLGHPETGAVQHLEDGEVAQDDGHHDRVVAVLGFHGGEVDGVDHVVEQVVGLLGADDAWETAGALRGTEERPEVALEHALTTKEAEVGAKGRRLAGDGGAGEAARIEVGEEAAQGAVVEPRRTAGTTSAFGPGHELGDVALVGGARVRAAPHE